MSRVHLSAAERAVIESDPFRSVCKKCGNPHFNPSAIPDLCGPCLAAGTIFFPEIEPENQDMVNALLADAREFWPGEEHEDVVTWGLF